MSVKVLFKQKYEKYVNNEAEQIFSLFNPSPPKLQQLCILKKIYRNQMSVMTHNLQTK
jgi:hypothetical protein